MLSTNAWIDLSDNEKITEFENAKTRAGLRPKTITVWVPCGESIRDVQEARDHVFRPLLPLTPCWAHFENALAREFPEGEYLEFHDKESTFENYMTLCNWIGNKCEKCGDKNLYWDQADKSIGTYCSKCNNEKLFSRGMSLHELRKYMH